jgi:hypothetical protein
MSWTCRGCGQNPCVNPSFCTACDREERAHPRRLYTEYLRDLPTPKTVIDAVVFCVRHRGIAALKEPANVERLSRCDEWARTEINRQVERFSK